MPEYPFPGLGFGCARDGALDLGLGLVFLMSKNTPALPTGRAKQNHPGYAANAGLDLGHLSLDNPARSARQPLSFTNTRIRAYPLPARNCIFLAPPSFLVTRILPNHKINTPLLSPSGLWPLRICFPSNAKPANA